MNRVVVTGLGVVSPCGKDVATTWDAVVAGRSGVGRISRFCTDGWRVQIAAEVNDLPTGVIDAREARRMDRFTQFAMMAAHEAMLDAGLDTQRPLGPRAGVYVGSGIGGLNEIEQGAIAVHNDGPRAVGPFFIPKSLTNLAAGHISIRYGASGPSLCVSTACAAGNHSIGEAWRLIRSGGADVVLAGGAEAPITPLSVAGFSVMRALSVRNDDPPTACRPFDIDRDGFVMGEGSGVLVLESLDHALSRDAHIHAEIVGYALTSDAYHITAPPPGHAGAARCMQAALDSARVKPADIDYINAHGTSTGHNDLQEARAIRAVFGSHTDKMPVSSTKSMMGHLLGAAGGLEAVCTVKALTEGIVPPTATLTRVDPEIELKLPTTAHSAQLELALSNAFGFGGTNATLVFRRWPT